MDWRKLGQGLGAGLTTFGAAYGQAQQQEQAEKQQALENKQSADKFAETKKMNDSLLEQRAQQAKLNQFKLNMSKAAESHKMMVDVAAGSGYAPKPTTDAINKYHPGGIKWIVDDAQSTPDNYVINKGYWLKDKDGNVKLDPKTGEKIFEKLPGLASRWEGSPKEFIGEVNKAMNPVHIQSMQMKDDALKLQLDYFKKTAEAERGEKEKAYGTESGARKKTSEELANEQTRLENEKLRKQNKGETGKPPAATFKDSQNKEHKLSSQEVEIAKADARSLKEKFGAGITTEQAWRMGKIQDDSQALRVLDSQLRGILDETVTEAEFLKLSKSMKVPREFLQSMIDDARENPELYQDSGDSGVTSSDGSTGVVAWFKNLFSSGEKINPNQGVGF